MTKTVWFVLAYIAADVALDVATNMRINRLYAEIDRLNAEIADLKKAKENSAT